MPAGRSGKEALSRRAIHCRWSTAFFRADVDGNFRGAGARWPQTIRSCTSAGIPPNEARRSRTFATARQSCLRVSRGNPREARPRSIGIALCGNSDQPGASSQSQRIARQMIDDLAAVTRLASQMLGLQTSWTCSGPAQSRASWPRGKLLRGLNRFASDGDGFPRVSVMAPSLPTSLRHQQPLEFL